MARYIASEDLERALSPVLEWAANVVGPGAEEASSVAYWDLVAVLNYPTDVGVLVGTLREQGRPDLDAQTLTERRDAYLVAALDGLDRSS